MKEKLEIEGNEFSGIFRAEFITEPYLFRGDTHERYHYSWSGETRITRLDNQGSIRALFSTPKEGNANFVRKLEHAVLCFTSHYTSWPKRPKIENYGRIVDLVLKQMYQAYGEILRNEEIIVPKLIVPHLDIDELTKDGLVTPHSL